MTESGKCREGLNRPNNFEVFSELIIQVLFCGKKFTDILLMVSVTFISGKKILHDNPNVQKEGASNRFQYKPRMKPRKSFL